MHDRFGAGARHNPFSSENVRPGSVQYRFQTKLGLREIVTRFESAGRVGQIVGPHGSGKSTLLAALAESLAESGSEVAPMDARAGMRLGGTAGKIILLDSAERLPAHRIRSLVRSATRLGGGLIVTAHRDIGLPTLVRTAVGQDIALEIIKELLTESRIQAPESLIIDLHQKHEGNMRLVLFDLYDWYETLDSNVKCKM